MDALISSIKGRSLIWRKQLLSLIFFEFGICHYCVNWICVLKNNEGKKGNKMWKLIFKKPVLNLKKWLLFLSVSIENSISSQTSILNVNYGNHSFFYVATNHGSSLLYQAFYCYRNVILLLKKVFGNTLYFSHHSLFGVNDIIDSILNSILDSTPIHHFY